MGDKIMPKKLKVADVVKHFNLEVLAGEEGLKRPIPVADLHRPGLVLAGYTNYYAKERIQLLGMTELSFLETLPEPMRRERALMMCQEETPCLVVSRSLDVSPELLEAVEAHHLPLLRTTMTTTTFASRLTGYLENRLAPSTTI